MKKGLLFCLAVASLIGQATHYAFAATAPVLPPIASTPCDTLYYESLSARAWLEAQREITQNQNIILKPDSVLEYTCFNMFVGELAEHASNMLSETTAFGGPVSSTSMDTALQNLVTISLRAYLAGNFGGTTQSSAPFAKPVPSGYDLLGGHAAGVGISFATKNICPTCGTMSYNCNVMDRVWQAAKCINFMSHTTISGTGAGTPTDAFFTFQQYADVTNAAMALDKRHRPHMCYDPTTNSAGYLNLKKRWSTNLIASVITPPWTEDPVKTYVDYVTPPTCNSSPCKCTVDPIPTGITVTRPNITPLTYEDKICAQPGCHYNPDTGDIDGDGNADDEGCYAR